MSACLDDETLALFAEDRLSREQRIEASAHLDACASCRDLLAHVLPDGPAGDSASIGRYRIERELGRGGMGVVYLARDPELDRKVAIKVLLDERHEDEARLLREARTMAKVVHPNVLTIHDVGVSDGRVYLAMEWVEGVTLREWLAKEKRAVGDVLAMFTKAGEGLAAAHRVGLVHRDFKPDNVLVGDDGRVRVADFGLAREASSATRGDDAPPSSAGDGLTRTGTVMGTPAYMAPEQLDGAKATARTDQFALAVAIWEALHGQRPFRGKSLAELRDAVKRGVIAPVRSTPRHLDRALRRALDVDPARRFPDVESFLAALRPPTRRLVPLAAAAAVLTVGGALVYRATRPSPVAAPIAAPCSGIEHEADDAWNAERRERVRGSLRSSDVTLATGASRADAADRAVSTLDTYAASWVAEAGTSCRAAHVQNTLSSDAYAARYRCLVERKDELRALVTALERGDPAMVDRAVIASASLAPIAQCESATSIGPRGVDPPPPAIVADVDRIRGRVRDARALERVGHDWEGEEIAKSLATEARALGYRPLIAEVLLALGELMSASESKDTLLEAVWMAEASHHDVVAARAWVALLRDAALERSFASLEEWSARASAAIERLVGEPQVKASLYGALAETRYEVGRAKEAQSLASDALRTRASPVGAETLDDASDLELRALAEIALDERDAASADLSAELAILGRLVGDDFDGTANVHLMLGRLEGEAGSWDAALASLGTAQSLAERHRARVKDRSARVAGDDASTLTAIVHAEAPAFGDVALEARIAIAKAQVLEARGELDAAETALHEAIDLARGTFGARNRTEIPAWTALAELLHRRGKPSLVEATTAYESAQRNLAPTDPDRFAAVSALSGARGASGRALLAEIPPGVTLAARLAARLAIVRAEIAGGAPSDADAFLARAGRLADPERERARKLRGR